MKKTKKEKLKAALHRQKEFARIKYTLDFSSTNTITQKKDESPLSLPTFQSIPKKLEAALRLTDLSYLPKQLIKIGLITAALIAVQLILSLIL